jgi:hypothetical protein
MKPLVVVAFAALAVAPSHGGPAERVILAAMQLAEEPNYSWSTDIIDDARSYVIEGKTQKNGCTWLRLPMVKSIAQRLGREADFDIEALFRGPSVSVIRTERGWLSLDELPRRSRDRRDDDVALWAASPTTPGLRHRAALGIAGPLNLPPVNLPPTPIAYDDDDERPYSNAQFGLSLPHEELAVIASSYADLRLEGNVATGTLTDMGARLLLVRDGSDKIDALCAAGTFKLFLSGGRVLKYFVGLEGILLVDRKRIHVRQESSTVVSKVGTTSVDVPDEARRKLGL